MRTVTYQKRLDEGTCLYCGGPREPGKMACAACLEKRRLINRKSRLKAKAIAQVKENLNLQAMIKASTEAGMSYGQYVARESEGMKWKIGLH